MSGYTATPLVTTEDFAVIAHSPPLRLLASEGEGEQVAQPVARAAHRHRREHEHETGEGRDPPDGVEVLAALLDHAAPRRRRRLDGTCQQE